MEQPYYADLVEKRGEGDEGVGKGGAGVRSGAPDLWQPQIMTRDEPKNPRKMIAFQFRDDLENLDIDEDEASEKGLFASGNSGFRGEIVQIGRNSPGFYEENERMGMKPCPQPGPVPLSELKSDKFPGLHLLVSAKTTIPYKKITKTLNPVKAAQMDCLLSTSIQFPVHKTKDSTSKPTDRLKPGTKIFPIRTESGPNASKWLKIR